MSLHAVAAREIEASASSNASTEQVLRFERVARYYGLIEAFAVANSAFFASLLYWQYALNSMPPPFVTVLSCLALSALISVGFGGTERLQVALQSGPSFLWAGAVATVRTFGLVVGALFLAKLTDDYSRGAFLLQLCAVLVTITVARGLFQRYLQKLLHANRLETQRVMLLGELVNDKSFLGRINRGGTRIAAAHPLGERDEEAHLDVKAIVAECRESEIDHVFIRASRAAGDLPEKVVDALAETTVTVHVLPDISGGVWRSGTRGGFGGLPTAVIRNRPLTVVDLSLKRAFDFLLAFLALFALAPFFVLLALAIRLDSKGPVFFRQTRHGYDNRPIKVFKFRSMRVLEDGAAFRQATKDDPRITRVGRFIRKTNLDELPQIINVLLGDMSIVGPRPHPVALNESFADRIKWFNRRHNIRPGITGWAQINGYRGETDTFDKMASRVEHDLWYIDNWSFLLDLKIVIMTAFSSKAYRNAG